MLHCELLLPLPSRNEVLPEFLAVCFDVERKLGDDGEPDIVRAENQVFVGIIGLNATVNEAIARWNDAR
jgi:hypothetical protein